MIVGCGQISLYNDESHSFAYNLFPIVSHKIRFQGFIVSDYFAKFAEGREKLAALLKAGKLKSEVTVVEGGMEKAPEAIKKLFGGANTGKLVLKC